MAREYAVPVKIKYTEDGYIVRPDVSDRLLDAAGGYELLSETYGVRRIRFKRDITTVEESEVFARGGKPIADADQVTPKVTDRGEVTRVLER